MGALQDLDKGIIVGEDLSVGDSRVEHKSLRRAPERSEPSSALADDWLKSAPAIEPSTSAQNLRTDKLPAHVDFGTVMQLYGRENLLASNPYPQEFAE